jgi:flagellar M-ring protein FliF
MAEFTAISQIKDFYTKLSTVQKVIFTTVPIAIIGGLLVILFSASPQKEFAVLFSDVSNSDASKIAQNLKENKIPYKLENAGTTIMVPADQVYETRNNLSAQGLPESGNIGYELFDKTNLGMSEFVQQVNYRRALEGELARTISSIDEVRTARVHIVVPEKALFTKDQEEPTASVTIHLKNDKSLNRASVSGIQTLIANSVEGLSTDNVNVIDHRGRLISEAPMDVTSVAGLTAQQLEQQKRVEQYLADKVQHILNNTLGVNNSTVQVNTDLDFTQIEQTITDYDPDRQVVRSEQNINEVSVSNDSLSYPAVNMSKEQSNNIQNYEIKRSVEHIIHQVGTIERLSVSVMVNGKYEVVDNEGIKELSYIPRTEEEMVKLQEIVENTVGFDPTRNDRVSVFNVPFDTVEQEFDMDSLVEIPWWQNRDLQQLVIMILLMLLTIILMMRLLKSKYVKEQIRIALSLPAKVRVDSEDDDEEDDDEQAMEELDFGDDDFLLMPAELPEQLLLEDDTQKDSSVIDDSPEEAEEYELSQRARTQLADVEQGLTEDAVMKLEIKNKVESYVDAQTDDAIRLLRILMAQDLDLPPAKKE